ncbi:hypothetical protein VTN00DRAFT_1704 [Thermoascus crustaceus]|uniref:uncharacterized protein n=1 Tax=Thermoascus crustaceus TaxID=5088 RepID=UPI00374265A8
MIIVFQVGMHFIFYVEWMRTEVGFSQLLITEAHLVAHGTHARNPDSNDGLDTSTGSFDFIHLSSAGVRGEGKWLGSLPGWYSRRLHFTRVALC